MNPATASKWERNAVIPIKITATISPPLASPKTAPRKRSKLLSPASFITHRATLAAKPNRSATTEEDYEKAKNLSQPRVLQKRLKPLCQAAILPCSYDVSNDQACHGEGFGKKPCMAAPITFIRQHCQMSQSAIVIRCSERAIMPVPNQTSSLCPVSWEYASRYFSLVRRATSGGSAGAGGCLFH